MLNNREETVNLRGIMNSKYHQHVVKTTNSGAFMVNEQGASSVGNDSHFSQHIIKNQHQSFYLIYDNGQKGRK